MSKQKTLGTALENRVVSKAQAQGLRAKRQPMSGMLKEFPSDVELEDMLVECKVRTQVINAKGETHIPLDLSWLRKVQALAAAGDYTAGVLVVNAKGSRQPVVVCDLELFLRLLTKDILKP